ncbi:MAG: hypothetical protein ABH875_00640 [Candidatus Omnitrophota bacterium]
MNKRTVQFVNIGLAVLFLMFAFSEYKKFKNKAAELPKLPTAVKRQEAPTRYRVVPAPKRREDMSRFERTFVENPREDVGGNVVEAWRNLPPEEAEQVKTKIDSDIQELEFKVKRDPEDEVARHKLKVSKLMKKLVDSGFDIGDTP